MSATASGMQWDRPFSWAPVTWVAAVGLARTGDFADALRLVAKFTHTVEANFERDHTIYEKYNVVTGSSDVQVSAGYKTNVVGFGWTNAVYLEMLHLFDSPVTQQLLRGKAGTPLCWNPPMQGNSAKAILTDAAHLGGLQVCHPLDRQISRLHWACEIVAKSAYPIRRIAIQ